MLGSFRPNEGMAAQYDILSDLGLTPVKACCPLCPASQLARSRQHCRMVIPTSHDLRARSPIQSALEKLPTIGSVPDNACDKQKRLDILAPGV